MEWRLVKHAAKISKLLEAAAFGVVIATKLYTRWVTGKRFRKGEKDTLKIRSKLSRH